MVTTIQVSRQVAERLKAVSPSTTYDGIISSLLDATRGVRKKLLVFATSVPAASTATVERQVPFDGFLKDVWFFFPTGPAGLVDVRILLKARTAFEQVIPEERDTFVALEDAVFPLTGLAEPVNTRQMIRVEWVNRDGLNAHRVPVYIVVAESV